MPTFQSPVDSATLFYRYSIPDTVALQPNPGAASALTLVFLHGWPMSSRMFDQLIVPLCETHRYRVVAPDRRGFGRSDWTTPLSTGGVAIKTLVADLVALLEHLAVGPFVFVGASMGCQESALAWSASPFVRARCRGFVWLGASMPYPIQCAEGPLSPSAEVWEGIMAGFRGAGGKQYVVEQLPGVFRADLGHGIGEGTLRFFEGLVWQADPVALERMTVVMRRDTAAEVRELAREGLPTLIIHGDSDTGMPLEASAKILHEMLPGSKLKVYEKAGHGLYATHAEEVVKDMAEFLSSIP